ncbi:MAG: DNA repair and recombination protein RadB [Candidatus Thermoplasmatota archaeon]|jgi:DNA repair protein RadB|nr:DNA repair and recombination protein RadB [Candidatus Thermoplasmatota archaeon]MCL5930696.1 DNA repair and recombination protein RadB [Candidatus Thermoplasmatota archaeon]
MTERLPTGLPRLDKCIEGGFERGIITEIYGEPGSGKTNLVLYTSIVSSALGKVIFIDTEGVSTERISQIKRDDSNLSNLKFFRIRSYEEQLEAVPKILNLVQSMSDVVLLVFDTITVHYRVEREIRAELRKKTSNTLITQIEMLNNLALSKDIPVILVNQVYMDKTTSEVQPVGGSALSHIAKAIFRIQKLGSGMRELVVIKHRSLPEDIRCSFSITEKGIE